MKVGQNPITDVFDLEDIATQLSQRFYMTPEQLLIKFLSIPPESEYEVKKRTLGNGKEVGPPHDLSTIRQYFTSKKGRREN